MIFHHAHQLKKKIYKNLFSLVGWVEQSETHQIVFIKFLPQPFIQTSMGYALIHPSKGVE